MFYDKFILKAIKTVSNRLHASMSFNFFKLKLSRLVKMLKVKSRIILQISKAM